MIKNNLEKIFARISGGNDRGEKITLVGATKFVDADRINEAIAAGLSDIGENRAQEFRDKLPFYAPVRKHFIGRLQSNKLKYVVGKADSIDSVDSLALAERISARALSLGAVQDVMLEANAGEAQKGGFQMSEIIPAYKSIIALDGVRVTGIMSMLPEADMATVARLTREIRKYFDEIASADKNVAFLSIGISGDYETAIENGSNMIRLGRAIFGARG